MAKIETTSAINQIHGKTTLSFTTTNSPIRSKGNGRIKSA